MCHGIIDGTSHSAKWNIYILRISTFCLLFDAVTMELSQKVRVDGKNMLFHNENRGMYLIYKHG